MSTDPSADFAAPGSDDAADPGSPTAAPGADATSYLAGLRLTGLPVLVAGGGPVAARRVAGLLEAGAVVTVVSPVLTPALEALADAGRIAWAARPFAAGDVAGSWYVVAATNDGAVNAAVAAEAFAARVFCSRADDADTSTVWTPAVGVHGGVAVGVLGAQTGDPRRSAAVRDAVVEGLRSGTLQAPRFRGRAAGVALVGGGPGDADLITVRGRRLVAGPLMWSSSTGWAPRSNCWTGCGGDVEIIDCEVRSAPSAQPYTQDEINRGARSKRSTIRSERVVRLKGGDPFVFGRGGEEMQACIDAGVVGHRRPRRSQLGRWRAPGAGRHPVDPPRGLAARLHGRLRTSRSRPTRAAWPTGRRWRGCAAPWWC